jgi:hypothetical protein
MSYIGSTPTTQNFIAGTDSFNGTGSATNFTLSRLVNSVNDIQVVVNNVVQYPPNYSVSGNTLTISPAPSAGTDNVYVRYLSTTLQTFAPSQGTVGLTQLSATGTPSTSTFLRGDNSWATPQNIVPQVTVYTSGSGTYTVPTNAKWLQVRMVGGGGGGGGSGSGGGTGGTGGATTFGSSLLTANGGTGGIDNGAGGSGGSASIGAGASGIAVSGGNGGGPDAGSLNNLAGGMGGASAFGGNGSCGGGDNAGLPNAGPQAGQTNTGGGGGGAAFQGSFAAGGGGAGGYVDAIVAPLSASYSYAVGAAGTAGTAGSGTGVSAGAAGGSGVIYITAYF